MMKQYKALCISLLCLLLTGCMLLLSASCAVQISAKELSEDYTRSTRDNGEITEEFIQTMSDFSMALFRETLTADKENGKTNHLVSPLSAVICLAMLANGAKGETLAQMESVFGMDIAALNRGLYAYTTTLYTSGDCTVSIADSIWYRDNGALVVREEFLQICADWYDAQQYAASFDETTRKDINAWVKENTDGMIESMLDEPIPAATVMYLINTLVFDAKWEEKYEKNDIQPMTFHNLDGSTATVEMLCSDEKYYLTTEGGIGFAKDYKGGAYSFVGLLPDESINVYDFAASLDGQAWQSMWKGKQASHPNVRFPEFTYEGDMDMTDVLCAMGMEDLFDKTRADLSGIGTAGGNLYCSEVCQKTFIEVNRNGTKAAAVTWGSVNTEGAPAEMVILNRPFVYAIVDNATGLPLFVGVVTELGK